MNDKKFYYTHEKQLHNYIENNFESIFGFEFISREELVAGSRPDFIGLDKDILCFIEVKNIATIKIIPQLERYLGMIKEIKRGYNYYSRYNNHKLMLVSPIVEGDELIFFCKNNGIPIKIIDNVIYCGDSNDKISKTKVFDKYMYLKQYFSNEEINQLVCLLNSGTIIF